MVEVKERPKTRGEHAAANTIRKVGIIGAGQMGSGIAHVCALSGFDVLLNDVAADRISAGLATISGNLARQVSRQRITDEQRQAAIIHHRPPPDLATRMVPRIGEVERPDAVFFPEPDYVIGEDERDILSYVRSGPKGVPGSALGERQLDELSELVGAFARRLPDEVAGAQMHDLERAGLDLLAFAWAGSTEPGYRHYFRIQGPTLLIEHDNTQGNGNHIHSAWRNPADDFGDDVLAEHYRAHHRG